MYASDSGFFDGRGVQFAIGHLYGLMNSKPDIEHAASDKLPVFNESVYIDEDRKIRVMLNPG